MKYMMMVLGWGALFLAFAVQAEPMTFTVTGGGDNLVQFESKAPLEKIVGTTDQITGSLTCDPADLSSGVTASISVAAASLKTGNKIRDGHMRDNHLDTDQYPNIEFKMANIPLTGQLTEGSTVKTTARGDFTCHGVTHTIDVATEVTLTKSASGQEVHVLATFQMKLSDYNIPRPQFLIMKLDEVQRITVDFRGVSP
ncbi:YceI family protein [bacterium]|nr:YceI family protein [bacterium]MBU1652922.1 YceI family protein [bacterium]MBU1880457.1 YceI family protein [bacterium]